MAEALSQRVTLGRVIGLYGVRGWVKVYSHTDPPENILRYSPWQLHVGNQWLAVNVTDGRRHGKGLVALLEGWEDREAGRSLLGVQIAVERSQLPALAPDEYYWADLIGLRVVNRNEVELGRVDSLMETGSNDVLVVRDDRERLIPYVPGDVVLDVDLTAGVIRVDWDPDF